MHLSLSSIRSTTLSSTKFLFLCLFLILISQEASAEISICFLQDSAPASAGTYYGGLPYPCPVTSATGHEIVDIGSGTITPTSTGKNNADAIVSVSTGLLGTEDFLFGYNGTTWDRLRTANGSAIPTGLLAVGMYDSQGNALGSNVASSDAIGAAQRGPNNIAFNLMYNGTTWERRRGNIDTASLITSTAQVAGTVTSADQTNYNGVGVNVVLDITTNTTCSVVLTIQGKDIASGKYYTLLAGAAVVSATTNMYSVYPGNGVTANVSASLPMPRTWRISETFTGVSCAVTGTTGASVIN